MASVTGGHYLFSDPTQSINIGINNGQGPVFPGPVAGDLNIEVFTAAGVSTSNPPPLDPGFNAEIVDPGGTIQNGFLTGNVLTLYTGNYQIQDEASVVTQVISEAWPPIWIAPTLAPTSRSAIGLQR